MGKINKYKNKGETVKTPTKPQEQSASQLQTASAQASDNFQQTGISQGKSQKVQTGQHTENLKQSQNHQQSQQSQHFSPKGGQDHSQSAQLQKQQGVWGGGQEQSRQPQGGHFQQQQQGQPRNQGGQPRQQQKAWGGGQQQKQQHVQQRGSGGPSKQPQGGQSQQQGAWGGGQSQQQGAWGGGQQQKQQHGLQRGTSGPSGQPQGGQSQQQGAWGGGQQQTQKQQHGQQQSQQQQGAWGGGQQQKQQHGQQGGSGGTSKQPQVGQSQQQGASGGGQSQQQGAWGGGQQQKQQHGQQRGTSGPSGQPQGGQSQQQGAWGGGQQQTQKQQHGQQQSQQQQGAWGGGQQQKQQHGQQGGSGGTSKQPQVGQSQQQGAWGAGQSQQQGAWGGGQQQKQQHGQQGGSGGPSKQPQGGQSQQQGAWGGGQSQQQGAWGGGQSQQQGAWGGGQQQKQQHGQQGGSGGPSKQPQGGQQHGQAQTLQKQPPQQGPRSSDQRPPPGRQQQHSVEKSFQRLSVSSEEVLPFKPKSCAGIERGTLGRSGIVEVNYLKLDIKNMPNEAYHYDVTITPEIPKKFLRPAFEQCNREAFPNILSAYDGKKSCYTAERLPTPIERVVQVVDSSNRTKEFKVEIKETGDSVVDLKSLRTYHNESVSDKPMRAIQVLDVVMAGNNHERGIRVGRLFYRRPDEPVDLKDGYEAWTGLFQAAILGEQLFLNVDIAHKSFPRKSSLIDFLLHQNIRPEKGLNNDVLNDVQRFLKGLDIVYEPPPSFGAAPKRYRVIDLGEKASQIRFRNDSNQEMTILEYFRSRGYSLKYPNLPCIKTGSTVRSIYLPMELCSIQEGQALNRKDRSKQVREIIRCAAKSTNVRKEKIMDILAYYHHNASPIISAFGIQIGSQFIKVPIRNLPAPLIEYMNGRTIAPSRGAWFMDKVQFLDTSKPQGGHKWGIIYEKMKQPRINDHTLENFKRDVLETSRKLNMCLEDKAEIIEYTNLNSTLQDLAQKKYALVFVVLSNFGNSYASVKQKAELEVGILTQCIKENTIFRTSKDRTVFSNILLKVNGKLNGTNHKIANDKESKLAELMKPIKNVMYLGADVTHPSPDQRHIPSVVGVAASHDAFGTRYNMQYRLQTSKREDIEDMESIVTRHLEMYKKYQKSYPEQIIYYRDGVSDGQFPIIKSVEIQAIKNACSKLDCEAKLTVVIVVKRHHTRFFPMKNQQHERDFNNVEPGTVVDQHITHPKEVQFFMVSHQSIQGTAKPTRYNVILDESEFNINLLQKLTYNLCHLFPRCNRVVSYPAPAYLAHLVAFRGRVYLEGSLEFSDDLNDEYEKRLVKPDFMESNPMYFI